MEAAFRKAKETLGMFLELVRDEPDLSPATRLKFHSGKAT
jgi:hypothetical protein